MIDVYTFTARSEYADCPFNRESGFCEHPVMPKDTACPDSGVDPHDFEGFPSFCPLRRRATLIVYQDEVVR